MNCEVCGREKARDVEHARMVTALCEREITPRLHGAKETCWRLGYERSQAALAAALRAEHASALERAAQVAKQSQDDCFCKDKSDETLGGMPCAACMEAARIEGTLHGLAHRALIPPAAAPEAHRDTPCGRCGHPLWWHQWSSKEHRFCSKPLGRDFCRCKNYEEPAAAPAADYDPITAPIPAGDMNGPHGPLPAAETGKGQGAEALPDPWALLDQARDWLDFMVKHPGDGVPHNLIARIDAALKRDARAAPPEREGK